MLTNDLTHGFAIDNLAMDDTEEMERPRSGSVPAVQFADDSDRDSDKEVSEIIQYICCSNFSPSVKFDFSFVLSSLADITILKTRKTLIFTLVTCTRAASLLLMITPARHVFSDDFLANGISVIFNFCRVSLSDMTHHTQGI